MKKNYSFMIATAVCAGFFSACQDEDFGFDQKEIRHAALNRDCFESFVEKYGMPAKDHTFGFGFNLDDMDEAELAEYANAWKQAGSVTRASNDLPGGAVNTNVNQWTEDRAWALKNTVHVPGWPNDDKYFYTQNGIYSTEASAMGKGNVIGDVTDYEIRYVSEWFRTHKNPVSLQLHVSDFFIQQVSTDFDRVETVPDKEANGTQRITHWDGPNQPMEYKMDKLDFHALDGSWTHVNNFNASQNLIDANLNPEQTFNYRNIMYVNSSGTEDFEYHASLDNITGGFFDKWVLVKLDWDETMPSGETVHRQGYYLAFDYQTHYKQGDTEYVYEPDGYYSNWIVKLTPGHFNQRKRWPKRFMTEDLGSTFDFDFNDAVFDLMFVPNVNESNYYDAVITVHAAGGTMPIYIGVSHDNPNYEIHNLLGYPIEDDVVLPINAGKDTKDGEIAIYRVKKIFQSDGNFVQYEVVYVPVLNPDGTPKLDENGNPIYNKELKPFSAPYDPTANEEQKLVGQMTKAAFTMEIHIENPAIGEQSVSGWNVLKNLHDYYKVKDDANHTEIRDKQYPFPQLFNCSTSTYWMQEEEPISSGYEWFHEWVEDELCAHRLKWDKDEYWERQADGTAAIMPVPTTKPAFEYSWDDNQHIKAGAKVWPDRNARGSHPSIYDDYR